MAELNFGLLNPPGSQSIGNAFVTGMDQAQAARLQEQQLQQSMQQNALAKAKMGEYQRGIAEQNALRNRMTQPGFDINNPQHQQELLSIAPVLGQTVLQHAATMAKTGAETARFGAQTEEARVKAVQAKRAFRDQGLRDMANNPSDANIIANHEDAVLQKMMTPEESAKQIDTLLKIPLDQRKAIFERAGAPAAAPEKAPAPPSMVAEYTFAKTPDGGNFVGTYQEFVKERARAGRPPAQPRPEQPAQPVIDPDNPDKIILVSREEAIRRRMTPANTVEKPMTEAQRVKYGKDKVSDKDVVTGAFAVTGELEKLTDELVGNPDKNILPAPGLNSITGYSALTNPIALPSGDARKALQKLETFKGKIMALGRQLASQEGKLGNMAVQEWKFVSDAVQKIDPAAGNLDAQMRDVVRQSKEYALRQQTKYDDTYADDLTAPPAGAGKPSLDSIFGKKNP